MTFMTTRLLVDLSEKLIKLDMGTEAEETGLDLLLHLSDFGAGGEYKRMLQLAVAIARLQPCSSP